MQDVRKILIIGGGESGVGAAVLAKQKGYQVFLTDSGEISLNLQKELTKHEISYEEKGHNIEKLDNYDLIIKSPGVPRTASLLVKAIEMDVPVWSEIEFGFRFCDSKIIGITGSNGKTTTTALTYHLLKNAGVKVAIGGNYGIGFCRLLSEVGKWDWIVLELSSFQLEDLDSFRPDIAVLLNITEDHLDRYDYDILKYGSAKLNIVENQERDDTFIYNAEDPITKILLKDRKLKMNTIEVSYDNYGNGIYSKELHTYFDIKLYGKHNLFNAFCAISIARIMGVTDQQIGLGLKIFKNVPHRLEKVVSIDQVAFVNDSKATNVDAVYYALEGLGSSIIWIAGGTDKGNDYSKLMPIVGEKVKALICLGIDNKKLKSTFNNKIEAIYETREMTEAVKLAYDLSKSGDTILLSPACASFDLFKNYIDRGNQFKEAVWKLLK